MMYYPYRSRAGAPEAGAPGVGRPRSIGAAIAMSTAAAILILMPLAIAYNWGAQMQQR